MFKSDPYQIKKQHPLGGAQPAGRLGRSATKGRPLSGGVIPQRRALDGAIGAQRRRLRSYLPLYRLPAPSLADLSIPSLADFAWVDHLRHGDGAAPLVLRVEPFLAPQRPRPHHVWAFP